MGLHFLNAEKRSDRIHTRILAVEKTSTDRGRRNGVTTQTPLYLYGAASPADGYRRDLYYYHHGHDVCTPTEVSLPLDTVSRTVPAHESYELATGEQQKTLLHTPCAHPSAECLSIICTTEWWPCWAA